MDVNMELRKLMDSYIARRERLHREILEAQDSGDVEDELTAETLHRQCRGMIAELFQTMKAIGILDYEEIEIGDIKLLPKAHESTESA